MLDIFKTKIFNQTCEALIPPIEGGDQWLPLVRHLLGNMLNVCGQCHLFSREEYFVIHDAARRESEILPLPYLPAIQELPDETVVWETWTRWDFFELFKYEDTQAKAARFFRTMYRNDTNFYDSLVYLFWQDRIRMRYFKEQARRFASDPMKRNLSGMIIGSMDATQWLIKRFSRYTQKITLPEDEREHAILQSLYKHCEELKETPLYELPEKFALTPKVVWGDVNDEWRTQHTQGRYPEGGYEYYDREVEGADGSKIPILDILTAEHESFQTQPEEIEEEFTQEQRQQLEQLLGKTGLKILEYRHRHQEIIGQHGEGKIIAQALNIAESTVGRYIGTKNHIGIFEKKANEIREILS